MACFIFLSLEKMPFSSLMLQTELLGSRCYELFFSIQTHVLSHHSILHKEVQEEYTHDTWIGFQDFTFIFQHSNGTDVGDNLPNQLLYIKTNDKSKSSQRWKNKTQLRQKIALKSQLSKQHAFV